MVSFQRHPTSRPGCEISSAIKNHHRSDVFFQGADICPGFASPSIFPSQGFSPSQGFASCVPLQPCFMPQPFIGFEHLQSFSRVSSRNRLRPVTLLVLQDNPTVGAFETASGPSSPSTLGCLSSCSSPTTIPQRGSKQCEGRHPHHASSWLVFHGPEFDHVVPFLVE